MLVLSRTHGQRIRLRMADGTDVWLTVVDIGRGKIRLGILAPKSCIISREELLTAAEQQERKVPS